MKRKSRYGIFKRIIEICFMHPALMTGAILLAVLSALSYFVPYLVIYSVIRIFFQHDFVISETVTVQIARLGAIAVSGAAINILAYFGSLVCSHIAAFESTLELRTMLTAHIYKLPMGFHIQEGSGKLKGILDDNTNKIQSFIAHKIPDIVSGIVYPMTMVVLIIVIDIRFGISLLLGIMIAYIFYFRSMGHGGAKHMMELYFDALLDLDNAAVEFVRGITVIKIFGKHTLPKRNFCDSARRYSDMAIPYTREWEKYMSFFEALMRNLYLFLFPTAAWISRGQGMAQIAPEFLFYLMITPSLATVIPKIGSVMDECMRVNEEIVRVDSVLKTPIQKDAEGDCLLKNTDIEFEHVCFSYTEKGEQKALDDITFAIPSGKTTAIIGASGSGKSTIAALLARFWDTEVGKITVGGVNIKEIPLDLLMDQISFVFQHDYLFRESIYHNLTMGKEIPMETVVEATKAAHCHEFIMKLPKGYDTKVGEEGIHLSGGEKQRLFIARAILKNSPILVLDEATASLDTENEWMIREGFEHLMKEKTVLIIAHRMNMTIHADQILLLGNGKILEKGTHEELLAANAGYKKMWDSWNRIREWKIIKKESN